MRVLTLFKFQGCFDVNLQCYGRLWEQYKNIWEHISFQALPGRYCWLGSLDSNTLAVILIILMLKMLWTRSRKYIFLLADNKKCLWKQITSCGRQRFSKVPTNRLGTLLIDLCALQGAEKLISVAEIWYGCLELSPRMEGDLDIRPSTLSKTARYTLNVLRNMEKLGNGIQKSLYKAFIFLRYFWCLSQRWQAAVVQRLVCGSSANSWTLVRCGSGMNVVCWNWTVFL